ncbi:MAG: hypothetical protein ACJAZV_002133 [Roseivirga sp.]|jgi:hypothetical protein
MLSRTYSTGCFLILCLFFAFSSKLSFGQFTNEKEIFKNGEEEFVKFINENIEFPTASINKQIQGLLIYSLTVNPDGAIDAAFLTKLDNDIEIEVARLLSESTRFYIIKTSPYTVYHTLVFSIGQFYLSDFKVASFKTDFEFPWIQPIQVYARFYNVVSKEKIGTYTSRQAAQNQVYRLDNMYQISPSSPGDFGKSNFDDQEKLYQKSLDKLSKNLKKGKQNKALDELNLLIRLNPFNIEHLQLRRNLESELGLSDYKKYDEALISILEQK